MANGEAAAAIGWDTVSGTADRRQGYDEDNKTRDYAAGVYTETRPIVRGGTGATTAAGARTALGLAATVAKVATATASPGEGDLLMGGTGGRVNVGTPTSGSNAATKAYVDDAVGNVNLSSKVSKSGDTMSGHLYLPASSPASSGYTVCYINGDGRVSRGASSARWKKGIVRGAELPDMFAAPFASYLMRADEDQVTRYGYIVEDLAKVPDLAPFVVLDDKGLPFSFDMVSFLFAQVQQNHREIEDLRRRLDEAGL